MATIQIGARASLTAIVGDGIISSGVTFPSDEIEVKIALPVFETMDTMSKDCRRLTVTIQEVCNDV